MTLAWAPRAALLAALISIAAPAAAPAEGGPVVNIAGLDALRTSTLSADRAVRQDCLAGALAGRAGVARTTWTAPADGVLTARLRGGSAGDWDLAAFDSRGRHLAGSAAFASSEVVQVALRRGTTVALQVCRRAGGPTVPLTTQVARVDADAFAKANRATIRVVRVTVRGVLSASRSPALT